MPATGLSEPTDDGGLLAVAVADIGEAAERLALLEAVLAVRQGASPDVPLRQAMPQQVNTDVPIRQAMPPQRSTCPFCALPASACKHNRG